jgi:hypothetical protein
MRGRAVVLRAVYGRVGVQRAILVEVVEVGRVSFWRVVVEVVYFL